MRIVCHRCSGAEAYRITIVCEPDETEGAAGGLSQGWGGVGWGVWDSGCTAIGGTCSVMVIVMMGEFERLPGGLLLLFLLLFLRSPPRPREPLSGIACCMRNPCCWMASPVRALLRTRQMCTFALGPWSGSTGLELGQTRLGCMAWWVGAGGRGRTGLEESLRRKRAAATCRPRGCTLPALQHDSLNWWYQQQHSTQGDLLAGRAVPCHTGMSLHLQGYPSQPSQQSVCASPPLVCGPACIHHTNRQEDFPRAVSIMKGGASTPCSTLASQGLSHLGQSDSRPNQLNRAG